MPVFSALAAIGSVIGSVVSGIGSLLGGLGFIGKIALSVGLNILSSALQGKPKPEAQGSELEVTYGEDLARSIILGRSATKGARIFNAPNGESNKYCSQVFRLSDFEISSIDRVLFEGEWRNLAANETSNYGQRVLGIDAEIYVKVYKGTMDQEADPYLISVSGGRWTSAHRGAGIAYAIVTSTYSQENLTSPADLLFEISGAPLYDPRKDSTVGGDGPHRWNDQSTWEFSENNALMLYALERGFYRGSELIVGKGVDPSLLPVFEYAATANVCDQIVDGEKRYTAGVIAKAGSGVTHDANTRPILIAMAGSMISLVDKVFPIAGASRPVVATITDDDLVFGEPLRVAHKKSRTDLANFVSGTFIDPASYWQSKPYPERIDAAALGVDGERLAKGLNFPAIHYTKQAQRIADIQLRSNRLQANADIVLVPRWLVLEPGDWITWQSDRFGWTKTFEVQSAALKALDSDKPRLVSISIEETGAAIFDASAYGPDVTTPVRPSAPVGLNELANPQAVASYAGLATGERVPAITLTWQQITDITVDQVFIQWRPKLEPTQISSKIVPADQVSALLQENVVGGTVYQVRHKLITEPVRSTVFTPWENLELVTFAIDRSSEITTLTTTGEDVRGVFEGIIKTVGDLRDQIEEVAGNAAQASLVGKQSIDRVDDALGNVASSVTSLSVASATQTTALARRFESAIANIDTDYAEGFMDIVSSVDEAGANATINFVTKATFAGDYSFSGFQLKSSASGDDVFSQVLIDADKFTIVDSDGSSGVSPFVFQNGEAIMDIARIRQAIAEGFSTPDGKLFFGQLEEGYSAFTITT